MKNSVCVWLGEGELPQLVLQEDNDRVSIYWGEDLEIYISIDELKRLAERIDEFLKEKEHVVSKR